MKNISDITAKDIMTTTIKSIDINQNLNKAVSMLNNERIHNLVVCDNSKYAGIFGYKQLVRLHRRPPDNTRIDNFIFRPPTITEDTSIIDIVEKMYRLNYKIMPVGDDRKIVGIISERDILNAILSHNLLEGKKVKDFMTPNPIILPEDHSLGKALALIREHNISRIPVIDKNNKLAGILESLDLIREITIKEQYGRDSGTSPSTGYMRPGAYISDIISEHNISLKSLISTRPVTAKADDMLADKIKENMNLDTSTIIVTDSSDYPIGIIAPKDIIQFLASLKEKEKLYVQISGLESMSSLDEFQKSEIHRMLDNTIKKISNITKPDNFTIHAKAYRIEGNKTKYAFRCKFRTAGGLIFAKNMGWDPVDAFSTLMNEVQKISIKKSKKFTDKIRSKHRDAKYNI